MSVFVTRILKGRFLTWKPTKTNKPPKNLNLDLWLIQWAFCSVAIFISRRLFFFLHVVCIYLFKFFGHPISFCPTSLGIANLLTALAVSRLANPEANLGALVICFCTFDIFRKATWLMCSTIFHFIWRFAWKYHYSLYIDSINCYCASFKVLPFSHMTESWPSFSDDLVSWLGGDLGCIHLIIQHYVFIVIYISI